MGGGREEFGAGSGPPAITLSGGSGGSVWVPEPWDSGQWCAPRPSASTPTLAALTRPTHAPMLCLGTLAEPDPCRAVLSPHLPSLSPLVELFPPPSPPLVHPLVVVISSPASTTPPQPTCGRDHPSPTYTPDRGLFLPHVDESVAVLGRGPAAASFSLACSPRQHCSSRFGRTAIQSYAFETHLVSVLSSGAISCPLFLLLF